jgi:glycosyltransferase involved in cell wall biosynthesis
MTYSIDKANDSIRVLWISARIFSDSEENKSGVWLKSLAKCLSKSDKLQIGNVSIKSGINSVENCDYNDIKQWAIPAEDLSKDGYATNTTKKYLIEIIKDFKPKIVQIWGSENFLKLTPFDKDVPGIKVLTMQGVLGSIAPQLLLGLSMKEIISTIGLKELVYRRNLFLEHKSFVVEGEKERKMIERSHYIIVQSEWTKSQIKNYNEAATFYKTSRRLREDFINAKRWFDVQRNNLIIYSAALGYPLKGLHTLLKALSIVKKDFPSVQLRLAGAYGKDSFKSDGYTRLIYRYIKKLKLQDNVVFLGSITAKDIIKNLHESTVFVNPSYIESYSLTLAEAMSVGTPSVVSYAGAMPELAEDNKEALFFTPTDYKNCAFKILKILNNDNLALELSKKAVERFRKRDLEFDIVQNQIEIYEDILRRESDDKKN